MKIKREFIICGAIFVLMAALPLMAVGIPDKDRQSLEISESAKADETAASAFTSEAEASKVAPSKKEEPSKQSPSINEPSKNISMSELSNAKDSDLISADGTFKILDTSSGEVLTLSDEEFLIGAVAAEMPPSYETEALKAQCVAAYTCYAKKRSDERANPHSELKGADFSADLSKKLIYLTPDRMKADCGEAYDKIYEKVKSIVDSVKGEVLTYNGEIITCTYFAISSGTTDSFNDVFGKDLPYLVSVSSPYDTLAPNYRSEKSVTADEFKKAVSELSDDVSFPKDKSKWVGKIERTAAETVKEITVGGKKFSGSDIRETFSLRSACFEIKYSDEKFTFTVKGYGHNVGMSQYGANEMAKQGADYMEILHHYYGGNKNSSP